MLRVLGPPYIPLPLLVVTSKPDALSVLAGPSFTVDAQGAAALAALTNGAMSLRFQTDLYKPNHAALVGGVYLMLTGSTWILLSAKGHLSPQGRCLSFDQSADGYVKSEGVANLVLTLLSESEDSDEVETKGIIAATHANHTGRGASLTAPSGPQQGELIQHALRQAAIAPATVDAVECYSHGRFMRDAVEAEVTDRPKHLAQWFHNVPYMYPYCLFYFNTKF